MKRHPKLSIRQPKGCGLFRATSFNPHNIFLFFDNLLQVLNRSAKIRDPSTIFNLDKTATTTVHKPKKIVVEKGKKHDCWCFNRYPWFSQPLGFDDFVVICRMKHCIQKSNCSIENLCVLIMDNHESHISLNL